MLSREALNLTRRDKVTPTMQLPFVRSIILRLEHAAINEAWEVCCFVLLIVSFLIT